MKFDIGVIYAAARRDSGEYLLLGEHGEVTLRVDDAVAARSLLAALAPLADLVTAHDLAASLARNLTAEADTHSVRVDRLSSRLSERLSPWRDENAARLHADHHFPRSTA